MTDRLKYYRKISACKNVEDIKKISKDLVDQCGKLPTAVKNLLYDAEIALTATEIGISNIYLNRNNYLQFKFIKPISDENFKKFMELMNSNLYEFKLNAENKINLKFILKTRPDIRINKNNLETYLLSLLKTFPLKEENNLINSRIIVPSLTTFKYRLYGLTDIVMFGHTNDLLIYFDKKNLIIHGFIKSFMKLEMLSLVLAGV